MSLLPPPLGTPLPPPAAPVAGAGTGASTPATAGGRAVGAAGAPAAPGVSGFANVWAQVAPAGTGSQVQVQAGDTLIGLVKAHYRQQGLPIGEGQAFRLAHQVAADNGIANPNLIHPDQRIDFARLNLSALARAPSDLQNAQASTEQALAQRQWATPTPVPRQLAAQAVPTDAAPTETDHAVLERTLARAADKGFVAASELPAVKARVLALAERYNFSPDDFARLTLMESGGMNPQASNGHCHGIIQFCDGPARGAASVGYKNRPRDILGLGLLQQLDLVDRYFSQAGLGQDKGAAKISLDELYLTVLTPAARSEKRRNVALDIAGPQASYLHVDRDRQKPITRESITQGLYAYTNSLLQGAMATRRPLQQYAQSTDSATR